ncbi:MAG: AraC family transcriptional regulator [Puniceicoccaceae bacterium]
MKYDISLDSEETGKRIRDTKIFFFDLNPPEDSALSIITAGWELTRQNYDLRRDHYPYHTIEFIESGSGTFTLDGTDYPLEPHSILTYRPNQQYQITTAPKSRMSKYWISISGSEVESFFSGIEAVESPVITLRDARYVQDLFRQLVDYAARYNFDTGYETCLLVLRLVLKRILNDCETAHQKLSASYKKYTECLEFMENNVARLGSVNELAAEVKIDTSYLIRLFKRFDSESPYKRLIRLKAREAAEILLYSSKSIREVSEEMGFEDQFIFSKCFKRVYGVSPKHFRDNFERG